MTITVDAIYEGGVLKPAQPLPLSEHEKVRVTIEQQPTANVRGPEIDTAPAGPTLAERLIARQKLSRTKSLRNGPPTGQRSMTITSTARRSARSDPEWVH